MKVMEKRVLLRQMLAAVLFIACLLFFRSTVFAAGDTLGTATSISNGSTVSGNINSTNEKDYYKYTVSPNSSVEFKIKISSYMKWVYVKLYDSNGREISSENPLWNSNIQQVTEEYIYYLNPGVYYIGIIQDGSYNGNYSLSVSALNANNLDITPDDIIAQAHNVFPNSSFTGVLATTEESDVYRIDVPYAGIIDCQFSAYMKWIYLKLLDKDGNQILSYNPQWDSNIGYSVNDYRFYLEKGTYYIQIYKDNSYRGFYKLTNRYTNIGSTETEKNDTIATADPISLGVRVTGLLAQNEESDIFRVTIPVSNEIQISLQSFMEYVDLYVYNSAGTEVYSEDIRWNSNIGYSNETYKINLNAGTYYIQIDADGRYRGKYQFVVSAKTMAVNPPSTGNGGNTGNNSSGGVNAKKNIEDASISNIAKKNYTGRVIRPSVTVKYGGKRLKENKHYTVSYKKNRNPGIATITIKGKGAYTGTKKVSFTIKPKKAALKTVKSPKKKRLNVTWKRDSSVTGYQVMIATNKSFRANKKSKVISKNKTTSCTFKNLKSKKTYYVKVRSYKSVKGGVVYGPYSSVKKIKVK